MGRPRVVGRDLPPGVKVVDGRYYWRPTTRKERERRVEAGLSETVPLGADPAVARERAAALNDPATPTHLRTNASMARALHRSSVTNARARNIAHEISEADVLALLELASGRCMVSGVPLDFILQGGRNPWMPSIDRIDPTLGYTAANCRIVCLAANLAMNKWGSDVIARLAQYAKLRGENVKNG